jgi:hypothetical protein
LDICLPKGGIKSVADKEYLQGNEHCIADIGGLKKENRDYRIKAIKSEQK